MDRLSHLPEAARSRIRAVIDRVPVQRSVQPATDRRPPFWRFLDEVFDRELADVDQPLVVVISDREQPRAAEWVRAIRPRARLHELPGDLDTNRRHVLIAALGKCDVIVDERVGAGRYSDIPNLFFHLRVGGVMLLRRRGRGGQKGSADAIAKDQEALGTQLAAIGRSWAARDYGVRLRPAGDEAQFGSAVSRLEIRDGNIMLVNRVWAQAKIREERVADLLESRPDLGRVIAERPPAEQPFRGQIRMSAYDHLVPIKTGWSAPTMSLRMYNDVLTSPGQVVTAGSIILPDTYRHWTVQRLRNAYVKDLTREFGDASEPSWFTTQPADGHIRTLSGAHYYLDDEVRGHFGHMLTEVVSRLWGWEEAKAADPSLKAIMHFNKHRELASWEVQLLGAAGIAADDIVFTHEPVRVERLVSATPMWVNPDYVHPDIAGVWRRIGDNLVAQSTVAETPKRIFIGRRIRKRPCRNAGDVEQFFESLGFTVVFPEELPLPDQIRMFRDADIIAGFIGSGMFNLMFSPEPKKTILVSSESYTGRNEVLMAGVLGHDLSIAWCRSEAEWAGDRFRPGGYHAGFTFDFQREGEFVRDVVAGLEV